MKHLQSHISRKLVLYIILFSSFITLILTLIQLRIDYNEGIDTINQRLEQISLTNLNTITQSLWTLDTDSISVQLKGLMRIPDIIHIELRDSTGEIQGSLGSDETEHVIKRTYAIHKMYRGKQLHLGDLIIMATKKNLYQKLIDTVFVILVSQAVKTFLVSIFILVLFYYLVTRHIQHIAGYQQTLDFNKEPGKLSLDRKESRKADELDLLVDSFNDMVQHYYHGYQTIVDQRNQLSKDEARFKAIFNSITDSIIVANEDREIMLVNAEFHKQFGYSDDEIVGQTTQALYSDSDEYIRQGKLRYHKDTISLPATYELRYVRKDGSTFPGETMGAEIRLPDGRHIGYVAIIRDITRRMATEEENRVLLHELQQAQKMESIGHLTGGIAHDFNNILASITGYNDLALHLAEQQKNEKLQKYLSHVRTSGKRATSLVQQMLAFSRNSPGAPEPLRVDAVITETVEILKPTLPSSIHLEIDTGRNIPSILMDKVQLQQILINICVNARDAMSGEGVLSIKTGYVEGLETHCSSCHSLLQGDYIDVSISDTGSGIDSHLINRIFDPFFTTKEIGKGTGMGLSVVHGILHQHDAHVSIQKPADGGTTFHLLFPPSSREEVETPDTQEETVIETHAGNQAHILIVDDEELVLHYMKILLEMHGYRMTITRSSPEALQLLKDNIDDFDLLITDQTMPNLTGLGLIREVQAIDPEFPVILCSGYSEKVNLDNARDMGVTAFIAKPLSQVELLRNIQRLIAKQL